MDAPNPMPLALAHLARRDRSMAEMAQYLGRKGFDAAGIEPVLQRLVQLGYLNEERLAGALIRETRASGRGPRAAWLKLKKKAIEGWSLERVVTAWRESGPTESAKAGTAGAELEAALAFIRRRYSGYGEDPRQARRAMGALIRRGFSIDVARKAVQDREDTREEL